MSRFRSKNLDLVTTLQLMTDGDEFMVYLGTDTMTAHKGMDGKGKVERRTAGRHGTQFSLRGKHEYLARKEVEFDSVEEVHGIGLRVVKDFLDGSKPLVEFQFCRSLGLLTVLIFPMGCKSLLGYLIHALRTNLHLDPLTLG